MNNDLFRSPTRDDVSIVRLYVMRIGFLLNFIMLGMSVWPGLLHPSAPIAAYRGVAMAFWAALSTLSAFGLRYPLKMMPMLLMQLFYKATWLLAVAVPLHATGHVDPLSQELIRTFVGGIIMDVIVIPWPYFIRNYFLARGDRWTTARRDASASRP